MPRANNGFQRIPDTEIYSCRRVEIEAPEQMAGENYPCYMHNGSASNQLLFERGYCNPLSFKDHLRSIIVVLDEKTEKTF